MRVIAGTARRLILKTPKGMNTRPTTDRIKETLFNILSPDIPGSRFLDLFSGSGGIGIEALSRGAKEAVFVEIDKAALSCIKDNIAHTRFEDRSRVIATDALSAIRKLSGTGTFDLIFMDPPYSTDLIEKVLYAISMSDVVDNNTLIVCEADIKKDFDFAKDLGFNIDRVKEYKTNKHVFLTCNTLED